MNRTLRLAAHLTMVAASAIGATRALAQEAAPAERGIVLKTARLSLDGKSTLHAFTSATTTVEMRSALNAALGSDGDWPAVLRPEAVKSFEVRIPVKSLKSDKEGLDKNMYKALKAEQHPAITFQVRSYQIGAMNDGVLPIKVAGALSVAGVEREAEVKLETRATEEGLSVTGEKELLMTDFGINPPKFMLGTLKTDNRIVIRFSLVLGLSQPVMAEAK
jgi:polyisoprenoid-binding protein YceI